MRLDKYLVAEGFFESRNRALEAIRDGSVTVDGKAAKPSQKVSVANHIEVSQQKFYVSRAARKLEAFLEKYPLDVCGKTALDIGSSTGGFAQILLENGVASLDCVDVGRDQLHHSLRNHSALTLHEGTDIRDFKSNKQFELITCDVSFISILHILDTINTLASDGCEIILLYKPQFEVGRETKRDSRGVVTDTAAIADKKKDFLCHTQQLGWKLLQEAPSSLSGKEGNLEYLYLFKK